MQGAVGYYNAKKEKQFEGKITLEGLLMHTHGFRDQLRKLLNE